jgi:hypothetical protein
MSRKNISGKNISGAECVLLEIGVVENKWVGGPGSLESRTLLMAPPL